MRGIHTREAGFTLVELVIVIVVVGVISAYAFMKNSSSSMYSLKSQGQTMANDVRHVQALATTWGRSLRITTAAGANGTYAVSCVNAGSSPCDVSPVINPATGTAFSVSLEKDLVLSGPATLDIDSLGKPAASATYQLTIDGATVSVVVQALTGFVTVTP